MKKNWQKPKLIVLVKSKPEEAVLQNCKVGPGGMGSMPVHVCASACSTQGS
jgi:hypothetical protein